MGRIVRTKDGSCVYVLTSKELVFNCALAMVYGFMGVLPMLGVVAIREWLSGPLDSCMCEI
jgi:hypothetical protein